MRIWKLPELTLGVILRGHKRGIWYVEFLPVDQCVITNSGDKNIKIWATSDVWDLTLGKKTEMLGTGGSDVVVNLWYDSTASDKEDAFWKDVNISDHTFSDKFEEGVLKGKELENVVLDANYTKDIHLAFELRRPNKLLELFAERCMLKYEGTPI
ncbi:hypothetical protein L6452_19563 [Arctium lappa]|uniref:Uncharacterized protein n=1 Tax=Arctium lappa TaxID=4217 RepID=A0ACB9BAQ9_ARCLA|nr:hypothetical protein L6452_19563 [Arctium lappa]